MSSNVFMNNQLERIADYIDAGKAGGGTLTIDLTGFGDMQGATAGQAGVHGLVPAPAAGDENKVLTGAGTWIDAGSGGELGDLEDVTITSPTSGESLKYDGSKWVNGNVTAELPNFIDETSGNIVTVEAAERPAKSLKVAITPVQSGSGDPSPENIRPISGWTGCNVTKTGSCIFGGLPFAQAFRGKAYGYSIDTTAKTFRFSRSVKANHLKITDLPRTSNGQMMIVITYSISGNATNSCLEWTYTDGTVDYFNLSTTGGEKVTIIRRINADKIAKTLSLFWRTTGTVTCYYEETGIFPNRTTSASRFEPYTGQDFPITFPSEAGTVYGGTLDVVNGVLMVTKANIASYDGETLPGAWISDRDVYAEGTTPTMGAQVVYDLDTPITYQLTPTEVQMLLGTNNIWADTGEVKELKYIPKTYNDLLEEVTSGGGAPDYSNPIISGNYSQPGTVYTATQDCYIYLEYSYTGTPCYIDVDGATVARLWASNGQSQSGSLIPLKAGNVVTSHGGNDTLPYAVYPII